MVLMALCTHWRRWRRRRDRRLCYFFVHHTISLFVYPHPSSNLWGEKWGMQSGRWGHLDLSTRKQGDGWLAALLCCPPPSCPSSFSTCTCQRCSGWVLQGSLVLSARCSHNISLSFAPVAPKIEPTERFDMLTLLVFSKAQLGSFDIV